MTTNNNDFDNMEFEDWLDMIRVKKHEESLTSGQYIKEINEHGKKVAEQYGITVQKSAEKSQRGFA
jgi:hypothetical protein